MKTLRVLTVMAAITVGPAFVGVSAFACEGKDGKKSLTASCEGKDGKKSLTIGSQCEGKDGKKSLTASCEGKDGKKS